MPASVPMDDGQVQTELTRYLEDNWVPVIEKDVKSLIQEAYIWLLVPMQPDPQGQIEWQEIRLQKQDSPILQASRKAVHEEHLIANYAASRLRLEALDPYLWRDVNHLDLKKLWEYLAYYLYLPRIKNQQVLLQAIAEGVAALLWNENFAYATGWDESKGRYLGLKAAEHISVTLSSQNLIVKPEVAQRQIEADTAVKGTPPITPPSVKEKTGSYKTEKEKTIDTVITENGSSDSQVTVIVPPKRFYGSVKLDALRLRRDIGQIADEVIQHLSSLVDAEVEITLELQVTVPEGVPENVIRTVSENCRVLKFSNQGFEQE
jgi:hypothetical protein